MEREGRRGGERKGEVVWREREEKTGDGWREEERERERKRSKR